MAANPDQLANPRERAALMRRLSNEHAAAGHQQIAAKLADVATEWEAKLAELEGVQ